MKKNFLILLKISTSTSNACNPEYKEMLATRARILELKKIQEISQSLNLLIKEEESLNDQLADLLEQLTNLNKK